MISYYKCHTLVLLSQNCDNINSSKVGTLATIRPLQHFFWLVKLPVPTADWFQVPACSDVQTDAATQSAGFTPLVTQRSATVDGPPGFETNPLLRFLPLLS